MLYFILTCILTCTRSPPVCVGWHIDCWPSNPKPSATEAVSVTHLSSQCTLMARQQEEKVSIYNPIIDSTCLEYVANRRLRCSSDLNEVVGARGLAVGRGVVLCATDWVCESGQLGPVRWTAGCVWHLRLRIKKLCFQAFQPAGGHCSGRKLQQQSRCCTCLAHVANRWNSADWGEMWSAQLERDKDQTHS